MTVRSSSYVAEVDTRTKSVRRIPTDLHPSDVLVVGRRLYVAQADADAVGEYDAQSGMRLADTFVGTMPHTIGSSPMRSPRKAARSSSASARPTRSPSRDGRVSARLPAGWYPTDAVPSGDRSTSSTVRAREPSESGFRRDGRGYHDYIAAIQFGSMRELTLGGAGASRILKAR